MHLPILPILCGIIEVLLRGFKNFLCLVDEGRGGNNLVETKRGIKYANVKLNIDSKLF